MTRSERNRKQLNPQTGSRPMKTARAPERQCFEDVGSSRNPPSISTALRRSP